MTPSEILIPAIRTVGILKPVFNPTAKGFESPQLEVKGTGFWLASGVFLTCAHVIEKLINQPIELAGMLVVGGNRKPYRKATYNILDFKHDIAMLEVEPNNESDAVALREEIANGLEIFEGSIDVGEKIAYAGFPLGTRLLNDGHSPSYAEGVIGNEVLNDREGLKTVQISGPVIGGYSGAPIVLQKDNKKIIAIVANSPSIEAGQANIFHGIHWKHIKKFAELTNS